MKIALLILSLLLCPAALVAEEPEIEVWYGNEQTFGNVSVVSIDAEDRPVRADPDVGFPID